MKVHYLQHHPLEGLDNIGVWLEKRGHAVSGTILYEDKLLPARPDLDWLIIMGGPMSVHDEGKYPWLAREKKFIEQCITQGKLVLGVCLGAQLIADVLGSSVYKNAFKEIGWFPVRLTRSAKSSPAFKLLPSVFPVFQWHEDTFDIPKECCNLAWSKACQNQAFAFRDRTVGLQFHLEVPEGTIQKWVTADKFPAKERYVQDPMSILNQKENMRKSHSVMDLFLDSMEKIFFDENNPPAHDRTLYGPGSSGVKMLDSPLN
ncbi:MAG: type 1 glutamine amidotransferase [bacterium]|nr:type 1 glutamine amidotransferase [bacterium]